MERKYKVDHIGLVVQDVEKTAKMFSNYLDIKDWEMLTIEPPVLCDMVLYGQQVFHSFKIAFAPLGDIKIELLMPIEGDSVYSEFLKEGKQGYHHIGLVFASEVELEETKEELIKRGGKIIQSGRETKEELIKRGGKIIQSGRIKQESFYCYIEKEGIVLELSTEEL